MSHTYDLRSNGLGGTREPAGTDQNGSTRPTSRPSDNRLAAQLRNLDREMAVVRNEIREQMGMQEEAGLDPMRFYNDTPDSRHARQTSASTDPGLRTSAQRQSSLGTRRFDTFGRVTPRKTKELSTRQSAFSAPRPFGPFSSPQEFDSSQVETELHQMAESGSSEYLQQVVDTQQEQSAEK